MIKQTNNHKNKSKSKVKSKIHPRSYHKERYDFPTLITAHPSLSPYVSKNKYGDDSINFFNPEAVKALNVAILKHFYAIVYYEIPVNYLIPPIPGRAEYIHHIADFLANNNNSIKPSKGAPFNCLDIGVGANCIYPIIGRQVYGWKFVGTDIDPLAIESAQKIVANNLSLKNQIDIRLQTNKKHFLKGIIKQGEVFDLMICNPPFYSSIEEAQENNIRKLKNLKRSRREKAVHNFGGKNHELWTPGGERQFVQDLIKESVSFAQNCKWFSCLISKEANLPKILKTLKKHHAYNIETIPMNIGNKKSRIIVWNFNSSF